MDLTLIMNNSIVSWYFDLIYIVIPKYYGWKALTIAIFFSF